MSIELFKCVGMSRVGGDAAAMLILSSSHLSNILSVEPIRVTNFFTLCSQE